MERVVLYGAEADSYRATLETRALQAEVDRIMASGQPVNGARLAHIIRRLDLYYEFDMWLWDAPDRIGADQLDALLSADLGEHRDRVEAALTTSVTKMSVDQINVMLRHVPPAKVGARLATVFSRQDGGWTPQMVRAVHELHRIAQN